VTTATESEEDPSAGLASSTTLFVIFGMNRRPHQNEPATAFNAIPG